MAQIWTANLAGVHGACELTAQKVLNGNRSRCARFFFFLPPWVRWWQVQVTAISPTDLSVPHERHPLCCPLAFRRALSDCVVLRRGCMPPRRRPRGRRHGFASAAASQKTLTHSYLLRGRGRERKQPCRFAGLRSMTQRSNEVSPLSLPNGVEAVA